MSTIPSDELVDPKTPSKIVMTDTISYNHGQLAQLGFHDKFVARCGDARDWRSFSALDRGAAYRVFESVDQFVVIVAGGSATS
jgi:hypothetical protein